MEYISLIAEYADEAVAFALALHAAALIIVNATNTPADDAVLAKAYKAIEFVAGFVTYKAKK